MVEWATVSTYNATSANSGLIPYPPTDPIQAQMCRNQLVRDPGLHQSFSILGIVLVLALGGIIIVLGLLADTVVGWLQLLTSSKAQYRREQWILEHELQLQRSAYEGHGVGGDHRWEGRMDAVPTTATKPHTSAILPASSDCFSATFHDADTKCV
jgi:hypothetical protein